MRLALNIGRVINGLADVKSIRLRLTQSEQKDRVSIYFWLVTFDKCLEEIDAKGDRAF